MVGDKRIYINIIESLFLALILSGCAGSVKHMQTVSPDQVDTIPDEGKSMIVFMRPSGIGYAIQSSVFEVKDGNPELIGIIAAKKKEVHELEPGEHLFMVIGESADFMSAELEANKIYYALVTPRMGVWKARFSLKPVHANELNTSEFKEWLEECEWVEKSPASDNWARENMNSIYSKYTEYYSKWISKDPSERPVLLPEDGE